MSKEIKAMMISVVVVVVGFLIANTLLARVPFVGSLVVGTK